MSQKLQAASATIRAGLSHPVIDADGHLIELTPVLLDYVKQVAGGGVAADLEKIMVGEAASAGSQFAAASALSDRRDKWIPQPTFWGLPTKSSLDRITVSLPKLLHQRLGEMGIDYAILYPTFGLAFDVYKNLPSKELRRAAYRGLNLYLAELFADRAYSDRMTPVALIPMFTPQDALEELDFAVGTLGMKAILMNSFIRRPIPFVERTCQDLSGYADRLDTFGIDSDYDYDPVWARCVQLKVSPTFHSPGRGWGSRRSPSNYTYNHIGHFAASGEAICKSLFMGGVTRRFPELRFGFLEGGAAWAASLFADIVGHWKKRNPAALEEYLNPANLDVDLMTKLIAEYGQQSITARLNQITANLSRIQSSSPRPDPMDDFGPCRIVRAEDIRDIFVDRFYFGCEADDPHNSVAFNRNVNPFGSRLRAVFGSDIGHFDVQDMTGVLAEAYELVEHGLIGEEDFHDFMFANPATLHCSLNKEFFTGTVVESAVKRLF